MKRYSLAFAFAAVGLCLAARADGAQRVLIADFETDIAALKSENDRIAVGSTSDAAVGEKAARIDWQDAAPGWSRGLRIALPEADVEFDALSLWLKADGQAYAAVELRVRHRERGNYRLPLIVPPAWQRFVLPLEDFRPWGIKERLVRENIGELSFRRIGWTGTFLVDQIEWIRANDESEPLGDSPCFSVDVSKTVGDCDGFWAGIGDDPARPFDDDVHQRLAQEKVFRYVRTHNVFTDGTAAWERGQPYGCRIYREDADGTAHYDFTLLDRMLDSFLQLGLRPILEADFMPADLAVGTARLAQPAKPGDTELVVDSAEQLPPSGKATIEPGDPIRYEGIRREGRHAVLFGIPAEKQNSKRVNEPAPAGTRITTAPRNYGSGLLSSPKDYARWQELVRRTAEHCMDRYGREEVCQWHWEIWNEPDLWWKYWHPDPEDPDKPDVKGLCRLYEHFAAGLQEADPKLRAGGPAIAGFTDVLAEFLDHTEAVGAPVDFISWHGYTTAPFQMARLQEIRAMVRGRPAFTQSQWQINEIGYLHAPMAYNRAGALSLIKLVDVLKTMRQAGDAPKTLLVYWGLRSCGSSSFETTEGYCHGLLVDYGGQLVGKPILSSYRMLARLGPKWLAVNGAALGAPVNVMATLDPVCGQVAVLAYHVGDYDVDTQDVGSTLPPRAVRVVVGRLERAEYRVSHYRLDNEHSSTFDAWKRAGKPRRKQLEADPEMIQLIARHDKLESMDIPRRVSAREGTIELQTVLPGCSASLWLLEPIAVEKP